MNLFDMTESQLEEAVESYYNSMYNEYYGLNKPEPCCKNCAHYAGSICQYRENLLNSGEVEQADTDEDAYWIEMDEDDYCPEHEYREDDHPGEDF